MRAGVVAVRAANSTIRNGMPMDVFRWLVGQGGCPQYQVAHLGREAAATALLMAARGASAVMQDWRDGTPYEVMARCIRGGMDVCVERLCVLRWGQCSWHWRTATGTQSTAVDLPAYLYEYMAANRLCQEVAAGAMDLCIAACPSTCDPNTHAFWTASLSIHASHGVSCTAGEASFLVLCPLHMLANPAVDQASIIVSYKCLWCALPPSPPWASGCSDNNQPLPSR